MKKQIIYSLLALTTVCLGACNNNDEIDTANSIFSTEPLERNAFDYWLLDNYTYPYNIDFMYRMKDIESDHKYNLVPADYDKAVALSKNHQTRLDGRLRRTGRNGFSSGLRTQDIPPHRIARLRK